MFSTANKIPFPQVCPKVSERPEPMWKGQSERHWKLITKYWDLEVEKQKIYNNPYKLASRIISYHLQKLEGLTNQRVKRYLNHKGITYEPILDIHDGVVFEIDRKDYKKVIEVGKRLNMNVKKIGNHKHIPLIQEITKLLFLLPNYIQSPFKRVKEL